MVKEELDLLFIKEYGWSLYKDPDDFLISAANLREEGQTSRAEVIEYLIARIKVAERTTINNP